MIYGWNEMRNLLSQKRFVGGIVGLVLLINLALSGSVQAQVALPGVGSLPSGGAAASPPPAAVSLPSPVVGLPPGMASANPGPAPVPSAAGMPAPVVTTAGTAALPTGGMATDQLRGRNPAGSAGMSSSNQLPSTAGQQWRTYDLRPYTGYLTQHDQPQQAIVDWVLRETGTDVWFSSPLGILNADRDRLTVYHTQEMHEVIANMVDRFVAGEKDPQVMHLRVMTVGSPSWRSQSHMLMQHVNVDSPGVQAWLLSKENAALVMSQLRQRSDTRQIQAMDLVTHNGQTQKLASTRGRNYVRNIRKAPTGWPPYEPETGEIQEGYQLAISPLLSVDKREIDCVIKAEIDQVDKLVPVDLQLPLPNGQAYRTRIDVPQVVSWRLHERFRWPSDMVLLLSCGVIASPERVGNPLPFLNLNSLTGTTAGRADALMFISYGGRAAQNIGSAPVAPLISTSPNLDTRGRF